MSRNLVYQIFVDRFAGPNGDALKPPSVAGDPWNLHAGGSLDGILDKLDYIQSLGADALYLTPIFRAPSNHKYDTESYEEVDARFGGDEAFDRLASACRSRGLGLILDAVLNHTGDQHAWFKTWPSSYKPGARWRGHNHLPELDLSEGSVQARLAQVLQKWLFRGATGWRLDCANDLGLKYCAQVTSLVRQMSGADGAIGEVMSYAEDYVRVLDGVMNYWFRESTLGLASGVVLGVQAAQNFQIQAERYRYEGLLRSWNVLSTHDTPRLCHVLPDAASRRLALALQFTLPGTPMLYYGDEIGMEGAGDPDNRRVMIWDEAKWDRETLERVKKLAAMRRSHRALREGGYVPMPQPGSPELLVFARTTDDPAEMVLVIANGSDRQVEARVFTPYTHLYDSLPLTDLIQGPAAPKDRLRAVSGRIDVKLGPKEIAVVEPDDTTIPNYRFLRRS